MKPQRKTITIRGKFPNNSNKLSFPLAVPFKVCKIIMKSISVTLPGLTVANAAVDGLYLVKTSILQDDNVLYHFNVTQVKFNDDNAYTFNVTAHSDTEVEYTVQSGGYSGTHYIEITNIADEPPEDIAAMGYISLALSLEFIEEVL